MANMTFSSNLLPATGNNPPSLGNSSQKWNAYLSTINGTDIDEFGGGGSSITTYTATIPTTGWSAYGLTDLYTVSVTVNGLTANDKGIIGLAQTGTESTDADVRDAFGKITRITTAANALVVYATEAPEVAIPVQLAVFD